MISSKQLKPETVKEVMQLHLKKSNTKIALKATKYMTAAVNAGIAEIVLRAANQASAEGSNEVTLEVLEKVIPQFLLDF